MEILRLQYFRHMQNHMPKHVTSNVCVFHIPKTALCSDKYIFILVLHIIVTYMTENITKLQKLYSVPRHFKAGNKLPVLFLEKPIYIGNILSSCKILIERPDIVTSNTRGIITGKLNKCSFIWKERKKNKKESKESFVVPAFSDYHYCTTSLNGAHVLCMSFRERSSFLFNKIFLSSKMLNNSATGVLSCIKPLKHFSVSANIKMILNFM